MQRSILRNGLLGLAGVAMVGAGGTMHSPAAKADVQVTVSQYGRLATGLPWFIGMKNGMFKKAGVDVSKLISGKGGGTSLRNMLASETPIGEIATSAVVSAIKKGVDLVVVYAGSDNLGDLTWASLPGKGWKSVKDLVGKRVGYTNPKSATEMTLRLVLEASGIPFDKVKAVPTGGLGAGLTLLRNGGVDAAVIAEPIISKAEGKFIPVFRAGAIVPQVTWTVGVTTRKYAEKNGDTIRKLIQVRREVVDWINKNPQEAAPYYAEYLRIDKKLAAKIMPKFVEWNYLSPGKFSRKGLETTVRGLNMIGAVKGEVDWGKYVDQQYLPKDLQSKL
ncbi:MAG: ABC transporter substrate-binding protein [Bauldia litoralis]